MAIETLSDLFYGSVDGFRKPEHLRYKQGGAWRAWSSDELRAAVEETSMGLASLGLDRGDHVAILSENRPEWAFADMAVLALGGADVPIYPSLPAAQVRYILADSEAKAVFVSNATQAAKVAEARGGLEGLKHVIAFEPVEGALALEELRARGREALAKEKDAVRTRAARVKASDLATIIYTSGTTGDPKGVMLTHGNLVSNTLGAAKFLPQLQPDWTCLSFLPLCHVFERTAGHNLMLYAGATIAYAESVERVADNMVEVRPQIMSSVPRLYEKMYARVHEKVAKDPKWRQAVFRWALAVGRAGFQARVARRSPGPLLRLKLALAERLVFAKIKERTGGRLEIFVSGGAPLSREIAEFFGAADILICEGYGLTETSPVITCNRPERLRPGSVGQPIEGVEVKIAEDGEILTRGPHVMRGYYKKPEATREAIDPEGFFHTGDIGTLDADGYLSITDRKKDLLVTSGGKKIAPQPIENVLKRSPLVAEAVVLGDRRKYAAALIVPEFGALERRLKDLGRPPGERAELVRRDDVVALYREIVDALNRELSQFERIKQFRLLPREFTIESGELTPTVKVRRRAVEQNWAAEIEEMYRES